MRLKKRIEALIVALCMVLGLCVTVDSNVKAEDLMLTIEVNLAEGVSLGDATNWLEYKFVDSNGSVVGDTNGVILSKPTNSPQEYSQSIPTGAAGIKISGMWIGDYVAKVGGVDGTISPETIINFNGAGPQFFSFRIENGNSGQGGGDNPPPGPEPGGGDNPGEEPHTYTFDINGVVISDVSDLSQPLKGNFGDLSDFDNLNLKVLKVDDKNLVNVGTKSGVTDSEGRNPLEVRTIGDPTKDFIALFVSYHNPNDNGEFDEPNRNAPGFYIPNLKIMNTGMKGIEVNSDKLPDMYDDQVYSNVVDLNDTSESNPAKTAIYYAADSTDLSGLGEGIQNIELVGGINPGAVTIDVANAKITYNSPFYASIPLKITMDSGEIGYVTLEKLGLELSDFGRRTDNVLHGSQMGSLISTASNAGESNLAVTFYYNADKSYSNYNIVATLTFADGSVRTVVSEGFGETSCNDPAVKGGDYLIWSGTRNEAPISVSATAVAAGAMNITNSFGGAKFGAGVGAYRDLRRD